MQVNRGYLIPREVITTLIHYIDSKPEEKFFGAPRLVCRKWRAACQIGMLHHYNQSKRYFKFTQEQAFFFMRRFGQQLRHVHIKNLTEQQFDTVINLCPTMTSFRTKGLFPYQVEYLAKMEPQLVELQCGKIYYSDANRALFPPQLKKVFLGEISTPVLEALVRCCPLLENLKLQNPSEEMLPFLPHTLTKLTVEGDAIQNYVFNLPLLQELTIINTSDFFSLDTITIPPLLRKLSIETEELLFPIKLPDQVKVFKLTGCFGVDTLPVLPEQTTKLYLSSLDQLKRISSFPKGLKKLGITAEDIIKLPPLPDGLKVLELDLPVRTLGKLPSQLKKLCLGGFVNIKHIRSLPDTLETFVCENRNLERVVLPKKLQKFSLTRWNSNSFPKLPLSLRKIEIVDCYLYDSIHLGGLTNLRKLALKSTKNTQCFVDYPQTLKKLRFKYCHGLSDFSVPSQLKRLTIISCGYLYSLPLMPDSLKKLKLRRSVIAYKYLGDLPSNTQLNTDDVFLRVAHRTGLLHALGSLIGRKRKAATQEVD